MTSDQTLDPALLSEVTLLLQAWRPGDQQSLDRLVPLVYRELRAIAGNCFSTEKEQTLCATALVSEVYVRLAEGNQIAFRDREHFFCVAGRMMRRILVEHARKRLTRKRGGNLLVTFEEERESSGLGQMDLATMLTLSEGLDQLEKEFPRAARILEWRIFAGLGNQEIADAANISLATVKREWTLAKQRLFLYLKRGNPKSTLLSDLQLD